MQLSYLLVNSITIKKLILDSVVFGFSAGITPKATKLEGRLSSKEYDRKLRFKVRG